MIKSRFFCFLFGIYLCSYAYGGYASYTREELLMMAKAQKSKIESIEYSFSSTLSTDHLDDKEQKRISMSGRIGLEHIEVGQKGFKKYLNQKYHNNPKGESGFGEQRVTFDGKIGTSYFPKEAHAEIKPDMYNKLHTNDRYNTAMLMRESTGTDFKTVLSEYSLVGMLGSKYATVREETEKVDGYDCHIIDIKKDGKVFRTVYIDTQRGFLPVKTMNYRFPKKDKQELIYECLLSDIRNFGGDIWFPLRADRVTMNRKSPRADSELTASKYVLQIKKDENGKPLLKVNHDIPDNKFKGNFAVRTQVTDLVTDGFYMVGTSTAADLDQFTDDRIGMAKEEKLPLDQFAKQYIDEDADKGIDISDEIKKEGAAKPLSVAKDSEKSVPVLVIVLAVVAILVITAIIIITKKGGLKQ